MKTIKRVNLTIFGYAVLIGLILSLSAAIHAFAREETSQQRIANEIIRFHVVANSDSDFDQFVKTTIQMALLDKVGDLLNSTENIGNAREIINKNIENIIDYAQIYTNHLVTGGLYTRHFPAVDYGNMTLPAGYYEALTIRIGSGTGSNWWCVMFPMLCFLEGQPQATPEMHQIMREVLTEEEYNQLFSNEINFRFRSLDMWNERGTADVNQSVAMFR